MAFEIARRPKSLSYSALTLLEKNPEEFFMRKMARVKAPSMPQADFMSAGSGFDAWVKSSLFQALGLDKDPRFEFDELFTSQVEPQNRDFALAAGKRLLEAYKFSGAYDELLVLLKQAVEPVQFETSVDGVIDGVPFTGKPDCRFALQFPYQPIVRVILDWKVKGYCSKHGASPTPGYMIVRDGFPTDKPSRNDRTEHKKYMAYDHRGLTINGAYMEYTAEEYADQVAAYGWLGGEKIGDENVVVWIDELVAKYLGEKPPSIRVATNRARVSQAHQLGLRDRIKKAWDAIESGHIFTDMDRETNDARLQTLEDATVGLQGVTADDEWFNKITRPQNRF